jgi:hypothetical protein
MRNASRRGRTPRAHGRMLAGALLALGNLACHLEGWSAEEMRAPLPDVSADVHLVVHNEAAGLVDVTVERWLGGEVRLGEVAPAASGTFLLDRDLWDSAPIVVAAVPVSGFGEARSAQFDVFAGDTITLTVAPDLRRSHTTVTVR